MQPSAETLDNFLIKIIHLCLSGYQFLRKSNQILPLKLRNTFIFEFKSNGMGVKEKELLLSVIQLLRQTLSENVPPNKQTALQVIIEKVSQGLPDRLWYVQFSAIPLKISKNKLQLSSELAAKWLSLSDLTIHSWSVDQVARTWLILEKAMTHEEDAFLLQMTKLLQTADRGELVAIYQGLPLYPYPQKWIPLATDGLRTNMTDVFDSIALHNTFPAQYFPEAAWNQMVLKAAFMDRPLHKILGIDERANAALADIISDYAHERWAAGRVVSPEFWRPVSNFISPALAADLERLFSSEETIQQRAAVLVCKNSNLDIAQHLLNQFPLVVEAADQAELTWEQLAQQWWATKV